MLVMHSHLIKVNALHHCSAMPKANSAEGAPKKQDLPQLGMLFGADLRHLHEIVLCQGLMSGRYNPFAAFAVSGDGW